MEENEHIWRKTIRSSGLVEYICEHGVGHPTSKSATLVADSCKEWEQESSKLKGITRQDCIDSWLLHGCDGCCGKLDFPGDCTPINSYGRIAKELREEEQKFGKEIPIRLREDSWKNIIESIRASNINSKGNFWAAIQHLEDQLEEMKK